MYDVVTVYNSALVISDKSGLSHLTAEPKKYGGCAPPVDTFTVK